MKILTVFLLFLVNTTSSAQPTGESCKVLLNVISREYKGECKKGLANGQGEAIGIDRYVGEFKDGMPNGTGTYYCSDSSYYAGSFLNGVLEGKGEMHIRQKSGGDSLVKGYWSGGEYRGKTYVTYTTDAQLRFDRVEASASKNTGDRVVIEISTTSGQPNSQVTTYAAGVVLTLIELIAVEDNSSLLLLSDSKTANKATWTYECKTFPIKLRGRVSNGDTFNFELYKSANWFIRLYLNR